MSKSRVAVSPFSPLIINKDGKYTGFEIDLWEAIARELDMPFEYEAHTFQELIPLLANKQADVALAGIAINEQREKVIDFSHTTLDSGLMILVNKGHNRIRLWDTVKYMAAEGYKAMLVPFLTVLGFITLFAICYGWPNTRPAPLVSTIFLAYSSQPG